jgi:hypothetical protein
MQENEITIGLVEEIKSTCKPGDIVDFNDKAINLWGKLLEINPEISIGALAKEVGDMLGKAPARIKAVLAYSELGVKGKEAYAASMVSRPEVLRYLVRHTSVDTRELVADDVLANGEAITSVARIVDIVRARIKKSTGIETIKSDASIENRLEMTKAGFNKNATDVLDVIANNSGILIPEILLELKKKDSERYAHFASNEVKSIITFVSRAIILEDVGLKLLGDRGESTRVPTKYSVVAATSEKESKSRRDLSKMQRDKIAKHGLKVGKLYIAGKDPNSTNSIDGKKIKIADPDDKEVLNRFSWITGARICVRWGENFEFSATFPIKRIRPFSDRPQGRPDSLSGLSAFSRLSKFQ